MNKVLSIVLNEFTHDNRVLNEAITLQTAGYDVNVIALHRDELPEHEIVEGFKVHRIILSTIKFKKFKIIKHLEYIYRTYKNYIKEDVDVVHCHDLTALPVGFLFKVFGSRKIKVVYDAHEYETEMNGLGKMRKIFYKILERSLIKYADVVITVSKKIGEEYQLLYGIEEPIIIYNCPWKREITSNYDLFREKFKIRKEQIIFLYQGIVSKGRGVEILLETFSKMDTDNAVIVFMGFGPLEEEIKNCSSKFSNIYFQEAVRPPKFLDFTASADYGLSFIEDISLSDRYCLPNKLFEYINAGIPVICSNLPEMKKFVEENGIGVIAKKITMDGLEEAISRIQNLDKISLRRKVSDVSEDYCWEAQGMRLLKTYEKLLN